MPILEICTQNSTQKVIYPLSSYELNLLDDALELKLFCEKQNFTYRLSVNEDWKEIRFIEEHVQKRIDKAFQDNEKLIITESVYKVMVGNNDEDVVGQFDGARISEE